MKQTEVDKLTLEQLQNKLSELRKEYFELKMSHVVTPLENPLKLRVNRRVIARINSAISKREKE